MVAQWRKKVRLELLEGDRGADHGLADPQAPAAIGQQVPAGSFISIYNHVVNRSPFLRKE